MTFPSFRPLRVAYVDHAARAFGAEHSLTELLAALQPQGIEPVLIVPPGAEWVPPGVEQHPAPLLTLRRRQHLAAHCRQVQHWLVAQRQVLDLLRDCRPQIVHANTTPAAFYAGLPARLLGIPLVWHVRDLSPLWPASLWPALLSTRVVAISAAVARHIEQETGRRPRLVRNGVDPRRFLSADGREERRSWGWGEAEVVFGFVGQWVAWKRPDFFLEVASAVVRRAPTARFVLAGSMPADGPGLEQFLRLKVARTPLAGRTRLLGYRSDIQPVLSAIDALLLPSRNEPFGRVLVEAMLAGRPVMATAEAGPLEIVRHDVTGWLLPPRPEHWVQACWEAVRDPARLRRMGARARQDALQRFHIGGTATDVLSVYAEIAGGSF